MLWPRPATKKTKEAQNHIYTSTHVPRDHDCHGDTQAKRTDAKRNLRSTIISTNGSLKLKNYLANCPNTNNCFFGTMSMRRQLQSIQQASFVCTYNTSKTNNVSISSSSRVLMAYQHKQFSSLPALHEARLSFLGKDNRLYSSQTADLAHKQMTRAHTNHRVAFVTGSGPSGRGKLSTHLFNTSAPSPNHFQVRQRRVLLATHSLRARLQYTGN